MADDGVVKKYFDKYDSNKNGVIDKFELKTMFTEILAEIGEDYPEKRNEQVIKETMEKYDCNNNGVIEFNEFKEIMNFLIEEKGYDAK